MTQTRLEETCLQKKKNPEYKYRNFGCSRFNRKTNISGKYADPCDTTAACVCLLICMYFSSFALLYVHRMQLHHMLEDLLSCFADIFFAF